jgi:hypothetical protein
MSYADRLISQYFSVTASWYQFSSDVNPSKSSSKLTDLWWLPGFGMDETKQRLKTPLRAAYVSLITDCIDSLVPVRTSISHRNIPRNQAPVWRLSLFLIRTDITISLVQGIPWSSVRWTCSDIVWNHRSVVVITPLVSICSCTAIFLTFVLTLIIYTLVRTDIRRFFGCILHVSLKLSVHFKIGLEIAKFIVRAYVSSYLRYFSRERNIPQMYWERV